MSDQVLPGEVIRKKAFRDLVQIGVVVRDLDHTVKFLSEVLGLGPFRYITYPPERGDFAPTAFRPEPAIGAPVNGPVAKINRFWGPSGLTPALRCLRR